MFNSTIPTTEWIVSGIEINDALGRNAAPPTLNLNRICDWADSLSLNEADVRRVCDWADDWAENGDAGDEDNT